MKRFFQNCRKGATSVAFLATVAAVSAQGDPAITADPAAGLSSIKSNANDAMTAAITIGIVVIAWGYVSSLIKKGKG